MGSHSEKILDQFTKQASLFQASHRSAESAIATALEISEVSSGDEVLDVACGPGVLACAFARVAKRVTGVDITPSMLERARELQATSGVANVTWLASDVARMPLADASFSLVIARYAFHHFEQPQAVLHEMARLCEPGGRVVVIDSAPPPEKAEAFNAVERIRDPSHTRALTPDELARLMTTAGLRLARRYLYAWEVTAESLVARSFPADGDRDALLTRYRADVGRDELAMNARYIDDVLHVTFPTLIAVGRK